MRNSRILLILLALVVAAGMGFASGSQEGGAEEAPTLVMVPKGVHPYYEPCWEGFQDAAEDMGVNADFQAPQEFDVAIQARLIEDLIAQGVDAITISANDDQGLINVVSEAMDAGIKVITFDAPAPSTEALSYIGTDNETAGYTAGEEMARLMGGSGKVAILQGGLGATNLNLRSQGFQQALEDNAPDIELVTIEDTKGDFATAVNVTESLLETYPDLDAIFGVSAYGAPAAGTVIQEQGRSGEIVIGGFDDLADTLDFIREDVVDFTLAQRTYAMGYRSVEVLLDAMEEQEVPEVIDTGVIIVNDENVDSYMDEMRAKFN
jgi:ribose transport system substrate-binding protein